MNQLESLKKDLEIRCLDEVASLLLPAARRAFDSIKHGDYARWRDIVSKLPDLPAGTVDFNAPAVTVTDHEAAKDPENRKNLKKLLKGLMPWRKGPYNIHGVYIDTEWRSDLKWDRLKDEISDLSGKIVLDVGCGNGYHCWRMYGAGASTVIGIDPSPLFLCQFMAISHFTGSHHPVFLLPMKIEDLPDFSNTFDTVFSMGLLYHRRDPIGHLTRLKKLIRPGGELVLETIILNSSTSNVLVPSGRYAKMNNVWFIPSPSLLETWLKRTGFVNIRLIDITPTTRTEQRRTEWMEYESLNDFLDPSNPRLTVEGYPAPERTVFLAEKPS